jgi:hypothetical protein
MLFHEWNIDDAKIVWQREAEQRGEQRGKEKADREWQSVVAQKEKALADKEAKIARLETQLGIRK